MACAGRDIKSMQSHTALPEILLRVFVNSKNAKNKKCHDMLVVKKSFVWTCIPREREREREVLLGVTIAIAMNGWMKRVTRNLSHT